MIMMLKQFPCEICGFKAKTKPALTRHKTIKHKKINSFTLTKKRNLITFKCEMCKSTFYFVIRLNTHTEKQHKRENHILTPDESPSKSSSICSPPLKQRKEDDIRENYMDKEKIIIL